MTVCERARQWISLELDGELSELEQAALARHLDGCPSCREASTRVGAFTRLLRDEPLATLERPPVLTPLGSRRARLVRRGAGVLAFAAAVGAIAGAFELPRGNGDVSSALSFRSLAEQKRFAHLEQIRAEPQTFVVAAAPAAPSFASRALG
jgi:ferric-dicitrate binding protein FerR (iron transport regulator)